MKDFCQYGNRRDDEWEILPWIPDPRPPFKIWVKPEQIAPFFLIPHHPYAISLLLKISDGFRTEKFRRLGLTGSSADWERLVRGVIQEFEENNSGVDLFHFDSDEDVFCVYSQYIDDLMLLAKMIRVACADEKAMRTYLGKIEYIKLFWEGAPEGEPAVILYEVDTENERLAHRSAFAGQKLDGFGKGLAVKLHDKINGIAALALAVSKPLVSTDGQAVMFFPAVFSSAFD